MADTKRRRKKVSGKTKTEVRDKDLHADLHAGIHTRHDYTLDKAVADWLKGGRPGRTTKTIETNHDALKPLLADIGSVRLTDLTAHDVRSALTKMATCYSTRTLQKAHKGGGLVVEALAELVGTIHANTTAPNEASMVAGPHEPGPSGPRLVAAAGSGGRSGGG